MKKFIFQLKSHLLCIVFQVVSMRQIQKGCIMYLLIP